MPAISVSERILRIKAEFAFTSDIAWQLFLEFEEVRELFFNSAPLSFRQNPEKYAANYLCTIFDYDTSKIVHAAFDDDKVFIPCSIIEKCKRLFCEAMTNSFAMESAEVEAKTFASSPDAQEMKRLLEPYIKNLHHFYVVMFCAKSTRQFNGWDGTARLFCPCGLRTIGPRVAYTILIDKSK